MNKPQEKHLKQLKDSFTSALDKKYRAGQKEHTGNLWDNPALLAEAEQEVIDLWSYIKTAQGLKPKIRAYICAPFRSPYLQAIENNIKIAEECGKLVKLINPNIEPVVVHTMVKEKWGIKKANVHGGPVDRAIIKMNMKEFATCDVLILYGSDMTKGMKHEYETAKRRKMKIVPLPAWWVTITGQLTNIK